MLDPVTKTFLFIFIIASMLAIGMQVNLKNLAEIFSEKKLLIKSFITNFIIIPLIGIIFIKVIPMKPAVEVSFILLSCAPGGLSAIQFISKAKDELAYAGGMAFLLSMLSFFISPLIIAFFLPKGINFAIPYFKAFWFIVLFLLLPMMIGMLAYDRYKNIADKLAKPMAIVGTLAFIAFIVITLEERQVAMRSLGLGVSSVMILFVLLTMVIGWLMGGPKKGTRQILASASSMRNAALALVIVTNAFPNMDYEVPVVAFSALMVLPNMIFTIIMMIWNKKQS
jgi:BASS family bile acid:Na+ symporter